MTAKDRIRQAAQVVKNGGTVKRQTAGDVGITFKPLMAQKAAQSPTMPLAVKLATQPARTAETAQSTAKKETAAPVSRGSSYLTGGTTTTATPYAAGAQAGIVKTPEQTQKTKTAGEVKTSSPAWMELMDLSAAELERRHETAMDERNALSNQVKREETPAAASTYTAAAGQHKAKETNPIPSAAAASGTWISEEDKRLNLLRLEANRKQDEVNDLATAHYYRKNQEQFAKLEIDAKSKTKFLSALELTADLDTISKALSAPSTYNGMDTRFQSEGEALKQKYGVSDLQALQRTLTAQKDQAVKELEAKGYDFSTMAEYDRVIQQQETNAKTQERMAQEAKDHQFSASVLSTLISPLQWTDFVRTVANGFGHSDPAKLDSYVPASTADMAFTNMSKTLRGTVAQEVEKKWGPVGSFAYQTGMSMADFLFNAAITGNFAGGGGVAGGGLAIGQVNQSVQNWLSRAEAEPTNLPRERAVERVLTWRRAWTLPPRKTA